MKLPEKAKKTENCPKFQRWMKETNIKFNLLIYYLEDVVTFDVETETGIPECHITTYLLPELARAVLGNIGPRSVLPRPRTNIPQYGPRAWLVSG